MITFYKANYNEFDASLNGGAISDEIIESGVLENLLPNVRAYTAEFGGERWIKFFAKTDKDILNLGICIAKPTTSNTEEVYLAKGGIDEYESDLDKENIRLYGGFIVNEIDTDLKK